MTDVQSFHAELQAAFEAALEAPVMISSPGKPTIIAMSESAYVQMDAEDIKVIHITLSAGDVVVMRAQDHAALMAADTTLATPENTIVL